MEKQNDKKGFILWTYGDKKKRIISKLKLEDTNLTEFLNLKIDEKLKEN